MIAKQKRAWHLFHFVALLLTLFLMIAGCADTPSQSIFALKVRPGTEVQVGQSVAIVAVVEPLEKLDLEWSVSGTAGGTLSANTGEQVVYTAGKEGTDIVLAEGTTASGASVRQSVLIVVGAEALTPRATSVSPTATLVLPTATITISEPRIEVECPKAASCIFVIRGTSVGIVGNHNYKIIPFVNPWVGDPDTWFPQPDRPLGSAINEDGSWQAEVRIGTEAGEEPGHHFEIVALVMDAAEEITADFQALPSAIAKSNIVNLVTAGPLPPGCSSTRPPLQGAIDFAGEVEIQTPANCTTGLPTESPILVAGTYEGIPDGVDIWALVYPPNMVYYIQSPSACDGAKMAQAGGNWQMPVYLGAKGGDPEWFDIVVVLADQEASQFFSSSVMQMCQTGQYYGMSATQLEQMNITEKNYITVQTLD